MHRTLSKKHLSTHHDRMEEELVGIQNNQLTADNILDKLLRPHSSLKKLQHAKYPPKFGKKDYETLSRESICLKIALNEERQTMTQLKFRLGEAERKVRFLEGIQEKWEQSVQENHDGKRLDVYTEILKKKIQELNELYLSSEEKITGLKKLPHISIFDEHTIEMEHLQRETIRLKAIIAASPLPSAQDDANLESKLLKLMKEENQKLKATIRLYENDKNLLKSRQTIQKRLIADSKKEIDDLKRKLTIREAELEKAQNETKNILLKKAFQLRSDQDKRENEEIFRLKGLMDDLRLELQRTEVEKEGLGAENLKLKKNEKMWESKQSSEDKEMSELQADNSRLRRIIEDVRADLEREKENVKLLENHSKKRRIESSKVLIPSKVEKLSPLKFEEIQLPLLCLLQALEVGLFSSVEQLIPEQDGLRGGRLVDTFCEETLLSLQRVEAVKLVRYLTESEGKVGLRDNQQISRGLCLTILKAAVNRMLECKSAQNEDIWRCLLAKARKLVPELEKRREDFLAKGELLELLGRHINVPFGSYVELLVLEAFNREQSENEVVVSVGGMLNFFAHLAAPNPAKMTVKTMIDI